MTEQGGTTEAGAGHGTERRQVVVAGGGPTGMMLAAELALAGVDVVIVEPRADQHVDGSRAGGLHARTIEVLDQRGIAERFVEAGQTVGVAGFALISLDIGDFPTRHPYVLALWQSDFEPLLAEWVAGLGVETRRGVTVDGVVQDDDGVSARLSDGSVLRADYLVGCDGGRSRVRKAAGIDFAGLDPSTSWMIAEVDLADEPELGFRRDRHGTHAMGRRGPDEPVRVVIVEPDLDHTGEPTVDELWAALVRVWGTDFGLRHAHWVSRFTDAARQAVAYRSGRVLLAGDAAHVHPPQGGQGLNTGVQDAVNLGWKLARVVRGSVSDDLLDSYHAERHPVGARVLHNTMAQVALGTADDRHQALRELTTELLAMDGPRRRIAGMISGLDIAYDLGGDHPLVGRRVPDLDLATADGATRAHALLHDARPVLLDLRGPDGAGAPDALDGGHPDVVVVRATTDGPWELPVLGAVEPVAAVLVRPDGHVAWAGDPGDPARLAATRRWFGTA